MKAKLTVTTDYLEIAEEVIKYDLLDAVVSLMQIVEGNAYYASSVAGDHECEIAITIYSSEILYSSMKVYDLLKMQEHHYISVWIEQHGKMLYRKSIGDSDEGENNMTYYSHN